MKTRMRAPTIVLEDDAEISVKPGSIDALDYFIASVSDDNHRTVAVLDMTRKAAMALRDRLNEALK